MSIKIKNGFKEKLEVNVGDVLIFSNEHEQAPHVVFEHHIRGEAGGSFGILNLNTNCTHKDIFSSLYEISEYLLNNGSFIKLLPAEKYVFELEIKAVIKDDF